MADNLRMTDEMIETYLEEIRKQLKSGIAYKNTVKLPEAKKVEKKTNLFITPEAYAKIMYIVRENSKEVSWHATAERTETGYKVNDVYFCPQVVTGTTVDTDPAKYSEWLKEFDDATYAALRFQGHSHVNMGVSPSSTDEEHRKGIISKIGEDGFYIFMIFNKSGAYSVRIYDARDNVVYDTEDVSVTFFENQEAFGEEMRSNVKDTTSLNAEKSVTAPAVKKTTSKKKIKKSDKPEPLPTVSLFDENDDDEDFDAYLEKRQNAYKSYHWYDTPDYYDVTDCRTQSDTQWNNGIGRIYNGGF